MVMMMSMAQSMQTSLPNTDNAIISATKSVESINHTRVQKAKADYKLRATWAPVVKYGVLSASIGITIASFLGYYWYVKPLNLSSQEIDDVRNYLKTKVEEEKANKKNQIGFDPGSFFIFLGTSIAQNVALSGLSYGIFSTLTGNLDWYIKNQTAYVDDLAYLQQSYNFYAIFKDTIGTTIQLVLLDVEKILGYLTYCKEVSFATKSSTVREALAHHMHFIEEHANILAQGFNSNQSKEYLMASTELLKTDITSATKFIGVYA